MRVIPRSLRRSEAERTGTMSVMEHLEELRRRIVIAGIAILVGAIVGWFLYPAVIDLLRDPYCQYLRENPEVRPPAGCRLTIVSPVDAFLTKLKMVGFLGLIVALPVVLYQLWAFIVPGLTSREKKWSIPFIVTSTLLFVLGAAFSLWTLPKALDFLLGFAGSAVVPLITFDRYLGFVTLVTLAFGLSFLFPVILVFLEAVGVLSWQRLASWRRWAILGIAIFAAVITPSGDPYSMLAMMIPMYVFYEGSIIIGRFMKRGRATG
ncbi:MAG TPA: twin-arginine translocase subunit TatC [Actinomycetota bacterium]|nr:twin-arginine translocase subunit TatC [Actinomycetota bacterium]